MRLIRSHHVHLAGIVLGIVLTGCGSSGSSSSGGGAYASFAWSIYDIQDVSYTTALGCAAVGASSVVVTLTNKATGTAYTQAAVSCAAGQMSTGTVPAGNYSVGFDLYGDPTIYGNSTTLLDSFDATGTFQLLGGLNDYRSPVAPFVVQAFVVDWSITYGGAASTCSAEGASQVELDFTVSGSSYPVKSVFTCTNYTGTSYSIPYGATAAQWSLYLVSSSGSDITSLGSTVSIPSTTNVDLGSQWFSL